MTPQQAGFTAAALLLVVALSSRSFSGWSSPPTSLEMPAVGGADTSPRLSSQKVGWEKSPKPCLTTCACAAQRPPAPEGR